MERLECWQLAMDLIGGDKRNTVNPALCNDVRLTSFAAKSDLGKLLSLQGEDWKVLDPKKYAVPPARWGALFVWSDDYATHDIH